MKINYPLPFGKLVMCALAATSAHLSAVTINLASDYPLVVINSQGDVISDTDGYNFELGAFANSFVPTASNKSQWADNWIIFTSLTYSEPFLPVPGYYLAGNAVLIADRLPGDVVVPNEPLTNPGRDPSDVGGYSSYYSPVHDENVIAGSTFDFSNQKGYLWIYDSADPASARVEQFLGSSLSWVFPPKFVETALECCDNRAAVNWSISDINETPPIGEKPPGPPETLQTIPEPGTITLGMFAALALMSRRRRR